MKRKNKRGNRNGYRKYLKGLKKLGMLIKDGNDCAYLTQYIIGIPYKYTNYGEVDIYKLPYKIIKKIGSSKTYHLFDNDIIILAENTKIIKITENSCHIQDSYGSCFEYKLNADGDIETYYLSRNKNRKFKRNINKNIQNFSDLVTNGISTY